MIFLPKKKLDDFNHKKLFWFLFLIVNLCSY